MQATLPKRQKVDYSTTTCKCLSVYICKYHICKLFLTGSGKLEIYCRNLCCRNLFLEERCVKIHSRNLADNFRGFSLCFYSGLVCEGFIRFVKSSKVMLCIVWCHNEFSLPGATQTCAEHHRIFQLRDGMDAA